MRRIIAVGLLPIAILSGVAMESRSRSLLPQYALSDLQLGVYDTRDGSLLQAFEKIAEDARGQVGISLFQLEKGEHLSIAGNRHFAMQSVFKIPLAMYILDGVDKGKFSLDQKVHIGNADWVEKTWSPMRDQYKSREIDISLREVLAFSVSNSDNIACDVLFRLAGGTQPVNAYVHDLGIKDMMIVATEAQMHAEWNVQYQNWCTPNAMATLFKTVLCGPASIGSGE